VTHPPAQKVLQATRPALVTEAGRLKEGAIGAREALFKQPQVLPRGAFEIRNHEAEDSSGCEQSVSILDGGVTITQAEVLQDVACINPPATTLRQGKPFYNVAEPHCVRKTLRVLGAKLADERKTFEAKCRGSVEVEPAFWGHEMAAILYIDAVLHATSLHCGYDEGDLLSAHNPARLAEPLASSIDGLMMIVFSVVTIVIVTPADLSGNLVQYDAYDINAKP